MEQITFGGEPFIVEEGRYLGNLIRFCREELDIKTVKVITNGRKITEGWMEEYGPMLDVLGVNCDSFKTKHIGRSSPQKQGLEKIYQIKEWTDQFEVDFQIDTMINAYNWHQDMTEQIIKLDPISWKVFHVKPVRNDVRPLLITDAHFDIFVKKHQRIKCLLPQKSKVLDVLVDEYMRFLNCQDTLRAPTQSILQVPVLEAFQAANFE